MLTREEMIRMISAADTGTILRAFAAIGGNPNDMAPAEGVMQDPAELAPWSRTEVKAPLTDRGPIVDIKKVVEVPLPVQAPSVGMRQTLGSEGDAIAPFAAIA